MIEAEHLTKSFSYHTKEAGLKNTFRDFFFRKKTERQVVKDVSFHIDDGEIVGFLGPNGAGKTPPSRCCPVSCIPLWGRRGCWENLRKCWMWAM